MKKALTIQAVLMALVALLLTGVLIFGLLGGLGTMFSFTSLGWSSYPLSNRQSIATAGISDIKLDYLAEDIELAVSADGNIVLEEYLKNGGEAYKAQITRQGGQLDIRHGQRDLFSFGIFFRWSRVVLYLPESYSGSLTLHTTSGTIETRYSWKLAALDVTVNSGTVRFEDIEADGNILLQTTSGTITVEKIVCGGDFTMKTNSGTLRVSRSVTAENIKMEATSGTIHAEEASGHMQAKTNSGLVRVKNFTGSGSFTCTSGSIHVEVNEIRGDLFFKTNSGTQNITLPAGASFHFYAQITSGGIHTPFNNSLSFSRSGNTAEGDVGQNPVHSVRCEATSGSIHIQSA